MFRPENNQKNKDHTVSTGSEKEITKKETKKNNMRRQQPEIMHAPPKTWDDFNALARAEYAISDLNKKLLF